MYQPGSFKVDEPARLHALIREHALGLLVASVGAALEASHVPVLLEPSPAPHGRLRFHLALANPLARALDGSREVLFVFQGPESYVSPDWYRSAGMVPTWNYAAVHAYGTPSPVADDELAAILAALSGDQEARLDKRPWTTDKLDDEAYAAMRRAIVGFDMPIRDLQGKWKMGQNRHTSDRRGVIAALSDQGTEHAKHTADVMSALLAGEEENSGR